MPLVRVPRNDSSTRPRRGGDAVERGKGPTAMVNRTDGPFPEEVFLNLAYGPKSEMLVLAYITGLTALGLTPVLALDVAGSVRRLDRIRSLLRRSQYSLHDLHRVGARRWNMILELGMAIECAEEHRWFVLDSKYTRALRALSDLNGTDIYEHNGTPVGVFRALLDIFSKPEGLLTVNGLREVFRQFLAEARQIQRHQGAKSPFERRVFQRLVIAARRVNAEYQNPQSESGTRGHGRQGSKSHA